MSKRYLDRHLVFLALLGGSAFACQSAFADTSADADDQSAQSRNLTSLDPVLVTAQALKGPQLAPSHRASPVNRALPPAVSLPL